MNQNNIKEAINQFYVRRAELRRELEGLLINEIGGVGYEGVEKVYDVAMSNKDSDAVHNFIELVHVLGFDRFFLSHFHQLLLEPWHTKYEDVIHCIQAIADPSSVPVIEQAITHKFPFLESYETGTRQFINQCGHALWSINTDEAYELIEKLTQSNDPIIQDEMKYRNARIKDEEYVRNYELDN